MLQRIKSAVSSFRESRKKQKLKEAGEMVKEAINAGIIDPTILTGPTIATAVRNDNRGNQFISYGQQVGEMWKRWRCQAQYGNEIVRLLIKFRAGLISGNGASFSAKGQEAKFLERFLEVNKFESSFLTKIVTNTELEGRALLLLQPIFENGEFDTIRVRLVRWERWGYEIVTDKDDEEKIEQIRFEDSNGVVQRVIPGQFVYIAVEDTGDINRPTPPIAAVLTNAINMGKALADWRDMNHLWGVLGLYFETTDIANAGAIQRTLDAHSQWALGDVLALPGKAYFPEPSGRGQDAISGELDANARLTSGATGVPIHHFGWAKEMSNRATAVELEDSVTAHTAPSRDSIEEGLDAVIRLSFEITNRITGSNLDHTKVISSLTQVSRAQVKDLMEVYLPLNDAGKISDQTLMAKIPGIDVREEKKKIEDEKEDNMERQAGLIEQMRQTEPQTNEPPIRVAQ